MSTRNLRTISQFCEQYPAFTQGSVRWHVFNAADNGLDDLGAIVRVGRRVYIDVDLFFKWIEKQQDTPTVCRRA